jgi:hypothetical protein
MQIKFEKLLFAPTSNAETEKATKEALSRKKLKTEDIDDLFNQLEN